MAQGLSLQDRVAIVTGSGRGIGKAIALTFADAGAHLVIVARTKAEVEGTAAEVRAKGRRALALVGDVTQGEFAQHMVDRTVKEFGGIDILVNNAGGAEERIRFLDLTEKYWDWMLALNLKSVFLCSLAAAKVMVKQKRGTIINENCGGIYRLTERIIYDIPAYRAATAGATELTKVMAIELAPYGIRVNGIAPGFIATEKVVQMYYTEEAKREGRRQSVPLKRFGTAEDIAWAALFLASDAASYITGEVIRVDGGPGL